MEDRVANQSQRHGAMERYVIGEIGLLYKVALSTTRNRPDAEDLVQETLVRAYRSIDRFDGRFPRAWLLTILRNLWINQSRRHRPEVSLDLSDSAPSSGADDSQAPEKLVVEDSFDGPVADALRALPEKFRSVVELIDVDGLSYQEAAAFLDVPLGTIMSRLHRGRDRIRQALGGPRAQRLFYPDVPHCIIAY